MYTTSVGLGRGDAVGGRDGPADVAVALGGGGVVADAVATTAGGGAAVTRGVGTPVEVSAGRGTVVPVAGETTVEGLVGVATGVTVIGGAVDARTGVKVTAGAIVGVGGAVRAIGVGGEGSRMRGPSASGRVSPTTRPPMTTTASNRREPTT